MPKAMVDALPSLSPTERQPIVTILWSRFHKNIVNTFTSKRERGGRWALEHGRYHGADPGAVEVQHNACDERAEEVDRGSDDEDVLRCIGQTIKDTEGLRGGSKTRVCSGFSPIPPSSESIKLLLMDAQPSKRWKKREKRGVREEEQTKQKAPHEDILCASQENKGYFPVKHAGNSQIADVLLCLDEKETELMFKSFKVCLKDYFATNLECYKMQEACFSALDTSSWQKGDL